MVEFETVVDVESYRQRDCYVFLRTRFYKMYAFAIVLLAGIYILCGIVHSTPWLEEIFTILLVALVTRYILLRLPKTMCGKLAESRAEDFPLKITHVFNAEGFQIKKGGMEHRVQWSEVVSIRETEDYLFFRGKRGDLFSVYKKLVSGETLSSVKSFIQSSPALSASFIPYDENAAEPFWCVWITKI